MAAGGQIHTKDCVTRFDQRLKNPLIGLGAGIWLDVNEITTKQLLGTINGEGLGHVHELATAIVTTARVTLGVFVGQDGTLGLHHGGGYNVFRGDQFDLVALTAEFVGDRTENRWVAAGEAFSEETGVFYVGHVDPLRLACFRPSIGRVSDRKQETDP